MCNKNIFLFMGPPGSGKGTLSALCIVRFGWLQLSTGNLCREHIQRNTEIGKAITESMSRGELVSDRIIADMVSDWIIENSETAQGIIFDGYPRTKAQAELLYELIQNRLQSYNLILLRLHVDDEVLIERVLSRVMCENKSCQKVYSLRIDSESHPKNMMVCDVCNSSLVRRLDDTLEAIQHRIALYHQHENEILNFYRKKGLSVIELPSDCPIEELFADFQHIIVSKTSC